MLTFNDNFTPSASPDWSNFSGNWTTSGGTYYAQSPNNNPYASTFLPFNVSNTDFQLTVTVDDLADGGIWLDADGTDANGILLVLGGDGYGNGTRGGSAGTSIYWDTVTNGAQSVSSQVNGVFTPGDTYTITVTINGGTYDAYLDPDGSLDSNSTLLTSLTSTQFSGGEVGLYDNQPNTTTASGSGPTTSFSNFSLAAASASTITFSDNFTPGPSPDWSNYSGQWTTSNGTYFAQVPNNNPFASTYLPFNMTNTGLQVTVTINNLADDGIWLDSDGADQQGVLLVLGGDDYGQGSRGGAAGTSAYWQIETNGAPVGSGELNQVTGVFTPGHSYTVTATVNGDTYSAYLDPDGTFDANSQLLTTLTSSVFSDGKVGLYDDQPNTATGQGYGTPTTFSDFSLQGTGVACFVAGTLIRTPLGEVTVENLQPGNLILTATGRQFPLAWIGRRSYAGRFLAANPNVQPIRFLAGSLGGGLPRRDLLVSPNHAMSLDGVLIPARCLVNGTTIVQERGLDRVDYFHVELDTHDLLLAEGAASESFVDDDSRGLFQNAHEWDALYPGRPRVPAVRCAPLVESGPVLAAIRRRLDGVGVQEIVVRPGVTHEPIRRGTVAVRLVSASGHLPGDRRRLGVSVSDLKLDGKPVALDDARLGTGWHAVERRHRWTNGDAIVLVNGARSIGVVASAPKFAAAA